MIITVAGHREARETTKGGAGDEEIDITMMIMMTDAPAVGVLYFRQ